MDPPFKRQRLSARDDADVELHQRRAQNDLRLKSIFESIFDKYGKNFNGIGDEIDLETGEIIVNNGHILGMSNERDVGGVEDSSEELGSDEWSDDEDSVTTSNLREKQEPARTCQIKDSETPSTEFETALQSGDEADSLMGDAEVQPSLPSSAKRSVSQVDIYEDEDDEDELASNGTEWLTPREARINVKDHWRLPTQAVPFQFTTAIEPAWRAPPLPIQRSSPRENEPPPPSNISDGSEDESDVSQPGVSIWAVNNTKTRRRPRENMQWTGEDEVLLRYLRTTTALKYREIEKYFPGRHKEAITAKWSQMLTRDKGSRRLSHSNFTNHEQPGQLRQNLPPDSIEYPKPLSRRAADDDEWIPPVVSIGGIFGPESDGLSLTKSRLAKHQSMSNEGDKVYSFPSVALPSPKSTISTSSIANSTFVKDGQNSMGVKLLDKRHQSPQPQAFGDSFTAVEREGLVISNQNMEACDFPHAPHPINLDNSIARRERLNDDEALEQHSQDQADIDRLRQQRLNSLKSCDDQITCTDEVVESQRSSGPHYVSNAEKSFEDSQTSEPSMVANEDSIGSHASVLSESCICQQKGQRPRVAIDCDEPQDRANPLQAVKKEPTLPDAGSGMQYRTSAVTQFPEILDPDVVMGSNVDPHIRSSQQEQFDFPIEKPVAVMPSCIGAASVPPAEIRIAPQSQCENLRPVISNQIVDKVIEADDLAKAGDEKTAALGPSVEELQPQSQAQGAISEYQNQYPSTESKERHSIGLGTSTAQRQTAKRKRSRPKKGSVAGLKSSNTSPLSHMNDQDQTSSQVGTGRQIHTLGLGNPHNEKYDTERSQLLEVAESCPIDQCLFAPELDASHVQFSVSTPVPSMQQNVRESSAHTNHRTSTVKSSRALETADSRFTDSSAQVSQPPTGLKARTSKACIADSFSSELFNCSDDDLAILPAIPPLKRSHERKYCKPDKARTISSYLADESDDELSTPIKTVGTPNGVKIRSSSS